MKFLKFLLILLILLIAGAIGLVFFSNDIVANMTRTPNSEFVNLKYSLTGGEMKFDDFIVNGKKLGKGTAKLHIDRSGFLGTSVKARISDLNLENTDLTAIYNAPEKQIDAFMEKIDIPIAVEKAKKTTESYLTESTKKIENLNLNIESFLNQKIKGDIENLNKIKAEYMSTDDLKVKAQKLMELSTEIKKINAASETEKQNIEKVLAEIEQERSLMLENISDELVSLEKTASLSEAQNISSYIFIDKGKDIVNALNKTLKATALMKEIKDLPLEISNFTVNNGEIKFSNLNKEISEVRGEVVVSSNAKAVISGKDISYEITYSESGTAIKTMYGKTIDTVVEYDKENLLEGKIVKLVSELVFENNQLTETDRTVLTEEEKKLLLDKISTLKSTQYGEIMKKYEEQLKTLETLVNVSKEKKSNLEKMQDEFMNLVSAGQTAAPETQSGTETPAAGTQNSTGQTVPGAENQQDSRN